MGYQQTLGASGLSDGQTTKCIITVFFDLQGVGGTVQFPNGYLKKAYEIVRESGGLCVADEVSLSQTHSHLIRPPPLTVLWNEDAGR